MKPAVVVLSPSSLPLARRVAEAIGGEVHGGRGRIETAERTFANLPFHLRELFAEGRPIVAMMAVGVLVRTLGHLLRNKWDEPPVLSLANDGSCVVPVLGGHHGANDLARRIAAATGGFPAVTTAGDRRFGVALDEPPPGFVLENGLDAKTVMAELIAGEYAWIEGANADWLRRTDIPISDDGRVTLCVSEEAREPMPLELLYRPLTLAVGVGAERGAPPAEAIALVEEILAEAGVSSLSLAGIFSLDLKADEPAFQAVAEHYGLPARVFDAATLEEQAPRLANPSDLVFRETGCHGVAEGAALAAVGPDGTLLVPKRKGARTTAALARSPRPIDADRTGRARGTLFVVGIGPGEADWRSPEASRMVEEAGDLVGYSLYLDLLGPFALGKRRHDFPLGAEEARVRHAMELAGEGRTVALVCSGDAGIYAMASLVFELLEKGNLSDATRRIAIEVAPGISALQAAAARAGAPLGHDFCTISLSDLLTPWEDIRKRVRAAAAADFVIAFYNPVSQRRRTQLAFAKEALLEHRPADTPVVLATNLGRDGETVRILTLAELDVEEVDMLTVVIVGSSQSRAFRTGEGRTWAYTPRGYAAKAGTAIGERP